MRYIFWLIILVLSLTIYAQPPQKVRADSFKVGSKTEGIDVTVFLKSFGGLIDSVALTGENGYEFWKDGALVATLTSTDPPTYNRTLVFLASAYVWDKDLDGRNYITITGVSVDTSYIHIPYNFVNDGDSAYFDSVAVTVGATGVVTLTDFQAIVDNFGVDSVITIPAFSNIEVSTDTTIYIDLGGFRTALPLQLFFEVELGGNDFIYYYIRIYYRL